MTHWVRQLIVANVAMFLATIAFPNLVYDLMLVPSLVLQRPWTLVTYMFLHGGMLHLLFNMIALFFFGPRLETRLGGKRFLWLYFLSGISGAFLSLLFARNAAVIGASGAVFGVLLGFALYWPRDHIYIWGVLPLEARWFVLILTGLSLYSGLSGAEGGIAHFAHLGGFLGGFAYLKWLEKNSPAQKFRRKVEGPGARLGDRQTLEQWKRIRRETLHEVNRAEFDRVSEKIKAHGVSSLTARERTFIERFSGSS